MSGKSERESPWFKYGSDKSYQQFCRKLTSALSGEEPCIYAHYRTAANSGIGIKPVYSGIPLTYREHLLQHQIGQFNFMNRVWWEYQVQKHLKMWAKIQ